LVSRPASSTIKEEPESAGAKSRRTKTDASTGQVVRDEVGEDVEEDTCEEASLRSGRRGSSLLTGEITRSEYHWKMFTYLLSFWGSWLGIMGTPAGSSENVLALSFELKRTVDGHVLWRHEIAETTGRSSGSTTTSPPSSRTTPRFSAPASRRGSASWTSTSNATA
jgi:hypothetical protein